MYPQSPRRCTVATVGELETGTYWVALDAETAVAVVVDDSWHDAIYATWGPAGIVMYGAVDSERLRDLSLSRLSLRVGGRPHLALDVAPTPQQVAKLWRAEVRFRERRAAAAAAAEAPAPVGAVASVPTPRITTIDVSGPVLGGGALTPRRPDESADDFYRRVAVFYRVAAEASGKPLLEIQTAAGVPKTTAARWAREARSRGFLADTNRGRV